MSMTHFQEGSIALSKRTKGPDVWVLRYRSAPDDQGKRRHKSKILGTVKQLPQVSDVKKAAANLRVEINATDEGVGPITVEKAWGHFQAHELHNPNVGRSPTTIMGYLDYFKNQIIPRWSGVALDDVKAVAVERWLGSLEGLAPGTRAKIRNHLSALFSHCIRHELYLKINPIAAVRQSAKRQRVPEVFSVEEMGAIIENLENPAGRVMVMVAAASALRRSEMRGLKWKDVDTEGLWFKLGRGFVRTFETGMKTEASRRGLPMNPDLAMVLADWRRVTPYPMEEDWVFASPYTEGMRPYWPDSMMVDHVRPAAVKAGIMKKVNWHCFRHSLGTLMKTNGEDVKTIQELLRHANSRITLDVYTQGDTKEKRKALSNVSGIFVANKKVAA